MIPPKFKEAYYFDEGVTIVKTDADYLLIDKAGLVLASGYEPSLSGGTAEGRVPACRNDKCGYLNLQGNVAVPLEYDLVGLFSGGLAPVKKHGKWGYIDWDGRVRIPFLFDSADPFSSGLAAIKIGNDSGFIDESGKFVFHLAFESASGFVWDSDVSWFWTSDDKFGYVNTSGKVIWGPTRGSPDHWPLLGWTEEGKAESCKGIPRAMRKAVARLPED